MTFLLSTDGTQKRANKKYVTILIVIIYAEQKMNVFFGEKYGFPSNVQGHVKYLWRNIMRCRNVILKLINQVSCL